MHRGQVGSIQEIWSCGQCRAQLSKLVYYRRVSSYGKHCSVIVTFFCEI